MNARKGGLRKLDPAVVEWQRKAATNPAALTPKQRRDRQRTRARYDVPAWLKSAVEQVAEEQETSASQAAALLLAWALDLYRRNDPELLAAFEAGKSRADTLRFTYNIEIPDNLIR